MRAILHSARAFCLALALLAAIPAAASAATLYASPGGSGSTCSQAEPCSLQEAIENVTPGGAVVLQPGTYTPSIAVFVNQAIDLGGEAGKAASTVIDLTGGSTGIDVFVNSAAAVAHDFTIVGADDTGSLQLVQGTVERVVSVRSGATGAACEIDPQAGTTPILRDSVCWVSASGSGVAAVAVALSAGTVGSAILRNDDFISSGPAGGGLFAAGRNPGSKLSVEAVNVIARGAGLDVVAMNESGGEAGVGLSSSNFEEVEMGDGALVSPSNAAGNQTAAPLFADPAAGDFRELSGSPTIDAGLTDPLNGPLDLAGQPRAQGICGVMTDIGAYETTPPAALCIGPPPSNAFRLKRVKKLPGKGTALLSVAVPGPGQFTLWGNGVKRVVRNCKGNEVLKLGVVPRGKAKKRLARLGKLQIAVKLRFLPAGGSANRENRSLTLVQRLPR